MCAGLLEEVALAVGGAAAANATANLPQKCKQKLNVEVAVLHNGNKH